MIFDYFKDDIFYLLKQSKEIGKYHQMLIYHNEISDKKNFNPEKCDIIIKKIRELEKDYDYIKNKWFGDNTNTVMHEQKRRIKRKYYKKNKL
jgi:hypothetical protein